MDDERVVWPWFAHLALLRCHFVFGFNNEEKRKSASVGASTAVRVAFRWKDSKIDEYINAFLFSFSLFATCLWLSYVGVGVIALIDTQEVEQGCSPRAAGDRCSWKREGVLIG